jgi:exopolysaccharide biosynthesis polyprenyl glycosylphosphotransferase
VKLSVVPPARGLFGTAVRLEHIADLPVIQYNTWDISRSTAFLKRVIDVAVALPAVVLLSPLLAAIALAVRLDSRGPALYVQLRAGLGGRPFRIYKFRTMVVEAEEALRELVQFETLREPMFKLENDPRVTRVGRVLRRTSLDELPQLFNVVRGDMSLVGPRPEQLELVARYSPEHHFRMAVKPGLTGPMQVYGRGQLGFEERLAVEREYVENLSLGRDVRILTLTLAAVVTGRGAY